MVSSEKANSQPITQVQQVQTARFQLKHCIFCITISNFLSQWLYHVDDVNNVCISENNLKTLYLLRSYIRR